VKLHLGRIVILSVVSITATAIFGSCASSEEGLWPDTSSDASQETGGNSSFGGIGGGVSTGGVSGVGGGFGGTTGGGFGTGGSPFGGTGGALATGGAPATGGGPGTGGTGGNSGTCNPAFCPSSTTGTACCLTPNGPCGLNAGSGCATAPADF
jgi:hypothetical protein